MSLLLDDFLFRAVLAGLGVALAAAPLGCFVVWRRMAYFGDATAHASLLGVSLALATDLPIVLGVGAAALAMALTVSLASGRTYAMDTMLGVASHGALAAGLVSVSFLTGVRIDLLDYLFGDILSVSRTDLVVIWTGAAVVAGLIVWRWRNLLIATLNEDLAASTGVDARLERLVLTVALALLVAVALKIVGALLITALLIVPPAAARAFSQTPETMAVLAALFGGLAVFGGLGLSWQVDTPAGPSIVTSAVILFLGANIVGVAIRRSRRAD